MRRAGLLYAAPAKFNGARAVRLVPFVVSRDKAYMLEFGHLYVRVFLSTGAYTGVEFASPYTEEQLPDIDYVQGADTMFLFHRAVAPQRLRGFSAANWSLSAAPFGVQPFDEQGYVPYGNLILAATTGVGVVAAIDQLGVLPSPHIFLAGDVGRNLIAGSGVAVIKSIIGSSITVDILSPFATTIYGWGKWSLDASPQAFLRPSSKDTVGSTITLYASLPRVAALTLSAKTGSITITASPGVFLPSDTNQKLYADSGQATLTYISATQCSAVTSTDFASTSYSPGAWGVTDAAFRQGVDAGSFVRINGGLVKLMSIRYTEATALLVAPLTSTVAAPPLAWTLETPVWSEVYGYPRTGTLHEQRLWCAGSTKYPQTIWGSRTGLYLDFTKGVADSDACSFTIASDEQNQISYLVTARALIAHTYGGEFTVHGGNEKPITPTNVQIKAQTSHGSKGVRPLTIGKESVFVQRAGRKVRAMAYQIQSDGYSAPDLALLAP